MEMIKLLIEKRNFFWSFFVLVLFSCHNEIHKNENIKCIKLENYIVETKANPKLILATPSFKFDTNSRPWSFNIEVSDSILNQINKKSLEFHNNLNLEDINYKRWFNVDVYYKENGKIESIEIPMEKGVEYFDMLIKILEENKIKDLEIAVKKLNYMKD
jgi:hypothetical protein